MNALGFGESPKESPKKNETVLIPKNERWVSNASVNIISSNQGYYKTYGL